MTISSCSVFSLLKFLLHGLHVWYFFPWTSTFHPYSIMQYLKLGILLASINGNLLSVCFYVATSEVLIKSYEFHKMRT